MSKYLGTDGKKHKINIIPEIWEYHGRNNDRIEFFASTGSYLCIRVAYDRSDIYALNPIIPEYAEYKRKNDREKVTLKLSKTEREYFRFIFLTSEEVSDKETENPGFELHSKTFYGEGNKMGRAVVFMNRRYHAAKIDFIFKVHKNKSWRFWYENDSCLTYEEKRDLENWFVNCEKAEK